MTALRVPEGLDVVEAQRILDDAARWRTDLREVGAALEQADAPVPPATASQLARVELYWRDLEIRAGLLDAGHVAQALGGSRTNRTMASRHARHLIRVKRDGAYRYPGFQFRSGRIRTGWPEIVTLLREAEWADEEIALWADSPNGHLGARTPLDVLDEDPAGVLALASATVESADW